ncbi:hypothetical protein AX14_010346 [Amanita brunnescens Koide BX004]|nr:hypothetical protein AX14_010346 [Amanita brunnescens Koide BX004]
MATAMNISPASNHNYNLNFNNSGSSNNNNNNHKRGNNSRRGCVRYLNLTPAEEKMFLVSSLVLRPTSGPGQRRSSPAQSVLGSAADTSPPVDVIMIGSSASGEDSAIGDGERMDLEEDGEEEEIQVVETWPWPTPAPTTPTTTQGRTTTLGTVKQRSSHGSLSNRSNTGNTTTSAARRRALKRARLKNQIRILGRAKTGASGAPLAHPAIASGEAACGGTRTGIVIPRSRPPGRRARSGT